jgi:hypothetical protein
MSDLLQSLAEFFVDLLLLLPRLTYAGTLTMMESALQFIPQSEVVDPANFYGGFSSDLIYFLTLFEVPSGLALVITSLVARFFLRRIPFIG